MAAGVTAPGNPGGAGVDAGFDAGPGRVSVLEQRYRRVLRVLPADYRRRWADEMVDTFLESVRVDGDEEAAYLADFGRPPRAEVASVLALAVRLRLGAAGAAPRHLLLGAAVRRAALIAVLVNTVLGLIGVGGRLWSAGALPLVPGPRDDWVMPMPAGVLSTALQLTGLLWLPAYLALVLGFRRQGRALTALAVLPGAVGAVVGAVGGLDEAGPRAAVGPVALLLFDGLLLLALVAFHDGAGPPDRRFWLVALPAATVGGGLLVVAQIPLVGAGYYYGFDLPGLWCAAVVAATLAYLVVRARRGGPPAEPPAWPLALALLAAATLALRVVTVVPYAAGPAFPGRRELLTMGVAGVVAVLAAGLPMAVRVTRALRSAPARR
jgi:hypothetical protein